MIDGLEHFLVIFRQVLDHHFQWFQHTHHSHGTLIEIFANAVFQQGNVGQGIEFGQANALAEVANGLGSNSSSAQT